jgi:hypothetical protein
VLRQTWFRGQFGTCSSNSTVQLFRHHHHVLWWIGPSDPPSEYKTNFHIQTTHTRPRDANSVSQTWLGPIRHMQLKFLRFQLFHFTTTPPTTTMLRWIGTSDPPWYHQTRLPSKLPTLYPGGTHPVSQTWFGATPAHAAEILPFHLPPPP